MRLEPPHADMAIKLAISARSYIDTRLIDTVRYRLTHRLCLEITARLRPPFCTR